MSEAPPSLELVAYKLAEQKGAIDAGFLNMAHSFAKLDDRLNSHDIRIRALESWQVVKDAQGSGISYWKPVLVAIGIIIAAITAYISQIKL